MDMLAKVGSALQDIKREGAGKAGNVLQGLRQPPQTSEKRNDMMELGELALEYSWEEILRATDGFSESRRLGAGASGTVFRGTLEEGTDVAIKIIEGLVGGGFEEEVRLLSKCRHPNVVMLLGFAREGATSAPTATPVHDQTHPSESQGGRRALVYELLAGGDVDGRLLKEKGPPFLWRERLRTAIDMTRGLAHLHRHRPEIFHRDIKPPNVLFGVDGAARIADFGLACISKKPGVRELAVESAAGTPGYADPLYAQTGVVTEASEVYSMGMVLIQLLSRRHPALMAPDGSCWFLLSEICPEQSGAKDRILHMLDPQAGWPRTVATTIASLALLCIHTDVDQRPSFMDLAAVLQDLAEGSSDPKRCDPVQSTSHQGSSMTHMTPKAARVIHAAPEVATGLPLAQAALPGAQVQPLQARRPVDHQVSDVATTRSPSFAESHMREAVQPWQESRMMRGQSFGESNILYRSGQGGYPHFQAHGQSSRAQMQLGHVVAQQPHAAHMASAQAPIGHAAAGYSTGYSSLGFGPCFADVCQPHYQMHIQQGVSMYVHRRGPT